MKSAYVLVATMWLTPLPLHAQASPGPAQRIRDVAGAAVREPRPENYRGAVQSYPYSEGAVYRLITAPEHITDIALEPGEALTSVAAGDTARWTVGDTTSGAGATARVHIMLKPLAPGLATNLIITTDRRVYRIALTSTARSAMAAVAWTYPGDSLLAIERAAAATRAVMEERSRVDPVRLSFGYAIRGDRPAWRPLRAFDDGRQTFIEFPLSFAQGEAPPLFATGRGGTTELVNYRISGRYYVVDRLFDRAEFRIGTKKQTIVKIVRKGAPDSETGQ